MRTHNIPFCMYIYIYIWEQREYHESALNRRSNTVGCAKQRPTVLVGTVCDYLDSFTLPVNPVSFFLFPLSSYLKLSEIC